MPNSVENFLMTAFSLKMLVVYALVALIIAVPTWLLVKFSRNFPPAITHPSLKSGVGGWLIVFLAGQVGWFMRGVWETFYLAGELYFVVEKAPSALTDAMVAVLPSFFAFVFQRSQLLKTSIYENVRIGNPQATRQQIMDALDAANCASILDKFPQREMTVIGAKGVYLSGGEVQRIAIARAILKNANIVIMDEASAAADPENEYELQQAFQKLMRGKTVIMIAHRLSSIQNVDQILFVQNGKVVEQGTHNELMACNGRYKDFQDVYCKANQWRLA